MGKRLVITEKPSVARDIVAALGGFEEQEGYWENDEFLVTFAVGHLLELMEPEDLDPLYKRWTLDTLPILPESFPLKPKEGSRDRLKVIKKLLQRSEVEGLINACDAGREGELIFREVVEYLGAEKPIERLWLQSMTRRAIQSGFSRLEPGERYEGLSRAAHCRNYSDWLIGMNATRALTRRLKTRSENQAWSAGRVQTPTLAMLVDREMEVLEHVPIPFWRIEAAFRHGDAAYTGIWFRSSFDSAFGSAAEGGGDEEEEEGSRDDRILDEARANEIMRRLEGKPAVASETRKPSREAAPPLFDLTSLQREANRRFGWSARRTLNAAQRCYEAHKALTYPRTDSRALPAEYRGVVDEVIGSLTADPRFEAACRTLQKRGLQNTSRTFDDSKVSDHFAIIPTGLVPAGLSGDDAKLFDLVTRRFLGNFHPPALWSRVERVTEVDGERFRSRSKVLQEPGWREVLGEVDAGADRLPPLVPGAEQAEGVGVDPHTYEILAEETKPPARITEARILSLMESAGKYVEDEEVAEAMRGSGIGTPATRADVIENLVSKEYALRSGRILRPSVKGVRLIQILRRMKAERLASPALTGELERHLSDVERGRRGDSDFMEEIVAYTREIVERAKGFEFEDLFPDDEVLGHCPLCQKPVYERSWFYRCKEPPELEAARKNKKAKNGVVTEVTDCPFRIWKDKSGRYIDRRSVVELLGEGRTRVLGGFVTRQGRTFQGSLELHDGEVHLARVEGGEGEADLPGLPEYEVSESPVGPCPYCKSGSVVETRSTFICEKALRVLRALGRDDTTLFALKKREIPEGMDYCPLLLPRTVCKREITREEAARYLTEGRTEVLEDFTSRRGRPFSATLFLKETGRHGFDFPPRGAKKSEAAVGSDVGASAEPTRKRAATNKAGKKAVKPEAPKKAGAKKTAGAKKADTKKATAKKATPKKASSPRTGKKGAEAPPPPS